MTTLSFILILAAVAPAGRAPDTDDPFAGDSRLLARQTIRAVGVPLRDVLSEISVKTGVSLSLDRWTAEDGVVVYAHDRPVADTLRAVARLFRFAWIREGNAESSRYTLTQTLPQRRAEEQEIQAHLYRTADEIKREIAEIGRLSRLTPEEIGQRKSDLENRRKNEQNPAAQPELSHELTLIGNLAGNPSLRLVADYFNSANVEQLVRLMDGNVHLVRWPATARAATLPAAFAEEALRLVAQMRNVRSGATAEELNFVQLRINPSDSSDPKLSGSLEGGVDRDGRRSSSGFGFQFPLFQSDDGLDPVVAPDKWQRIDSLMRRVSVVSDYVQRFRLGRPDTVQELEPAEMARVIRSLQGALPFDVVADAFHSNRQATLALQDKPLGEALTETARQLAHQWEYRDDWVIVRSRHHAADRLSEPPATAMARWINTPQNAIFTIDRLAEIYSLAGPKFAKAIAILQQRFGHSIQIHRARNALLFWSALSKGQREMAQSQRGLSYRLLNPELKRAFELASLDRLAPEGIVTGNQERDWPREELVNATLRVTVDEREAWGLVSQNGYSTGDGTREAVFEDMKKSHPGLNVEQLQRAIVSNVRFDFSSSGGFHIETQFWLPIRWQKENTANTKD